MSLEHADDAPEVDADLLTADDVNAADDVDAADDDAVYYEEQVEPEYGILGFTLRELIIVGAWLVAFAVSFFPVTSGGGSIWTRGIDWVLAIGVPTVAVFLIVLRRFSPQGIRRVGSLGIDQFASVAASVATVVWAGLVWNQVAATIEVGAFLVSWVPIVAAIAALALVTATVAAPLIPRLRDDFEGRMETLAHRSANPIRPVISRPRPEPTAVPDADQPDAEEAEHADAEDGTAAAADLEDASAVAEASAVATEQEDALTVVLSDVVPRTDASPWAPPTEPAVAEEAAAVAVEDDSTRVLDLPVLDSTPFGGAPVDGAPVDGTPVGGGADVGGIEPSGLADSPASSWSAPEESTPGPGAPFAVEPPAAPQPAPEDRDPGIADADRDPGVAYTDPIGALNDIFDAAEHEGAEHESVDHTLGRSADELPLRRTRNEHARAAQADGAGSATQTAGAPFWALAATERDVLDEQGHPLFRIGPDAWILVVEDRGGAFVVRHDDGRIGYLHDLTDITKG
ncbi:hypothetical protein [Microbacterium sp.]|uniref:hypothetical protein n=1 Tax=Microbacterium sp. TaxID=51671 RepID=UPI003A945616